MSMGAKYGTNKERVKKKKKQTIKLTNKQTESIKFCNKAQK